MSRNLQPAPELYEMSQRLHALARRSGVIALELRTEVGAFACDTLSLLSKLAGNIPTVARVAGPDVRGDIRRSLDAGIRSIRSPVVDSGYALGDFIQALRATAGDAFPGVRKTINIETPNGYRKLAEIVQHPDFVHIDEVGLNLRGLAAAHRSGFGDSTDEMVRDVCATVRRQGKRLAVGGGITAANASALVARVGPDYLHTGMLVIEVAKVRDISDAVRQALEFERFWADGVAEKSPVARPVAFLPPQGPDPATDGLSASLQARGLFKFITGIENADRADIRFLAQVYALAGADIIDVAARPDVVEATREAIAAVREWSSGHPPLGAQIMVSLALEHDPHVEKPADRPEHRAFVVPADAAHMAANVDACLQEGADMVELHASDSEDPALREAVEALSAVLEGRYLSVCLGAEGWRSPRDVIRQATLVREIHGPHTMIQAEGISLVKDGSLASSVQGLALAQALLVHTRAYVVVAGGANYWTRDLSDMLGIPIHGIASGSYARHLVEGFGDVAAAARLARRFADHARGGAGHAV